MKFRFLILLLAPITLLHSALGASTTAAEDRLKAAVKEVLALAAEASSPSDLARDLRPVLLKNISFDAMTRRAVGPGWRQFTAPQQEKAIALFTTLVIRTYGDKFTPGERPNIQFKAATSPAPGRVEIPTTILYQGSRYEVVYRLEESEGWRITDVVIEGISLVANYRSQFDAAFKKDGANGVISALTQAEDQS